MTAGSDPNGKPGAAAGCRERAFGGRRDPDEPRVRRAADAGAAGSAAAAVEYAAAASAGTAGAVSRATAAPPRRPRRPHRPLVDAAGARLTRRPARRRTTRRPADPTSSLSSTSGPACTSSAEPRDGLLLSRIGWRSPWPEVCWPPSAACFTWATLRLTRPRATDSGSTTDRVEHHLQRPLAAGRPGRPGARRSSRSRWPVSPDCRGAPRLLAVGLAVDGRVAVLVMGFAAIGHPVGLVDTFPVIPPDRRVRVSLPNGAGLACASVGAAPDTEQAGCWPSCEGSAEHLSAAGATEGPA